MKGVLAPSLRTSDWVARPWIDTSGISAPSLEQITLTGLNENHLVNWLASSILFRDKQRRLGSLIIGAMIFNQIDLIDYWNMLISFMSNITLFAGRTDVKKLRNKNVGNGLCLLKTEKCALNMNGFCWDYQTIISKKKNT